MLHHIPGIVATTDGGLLAFCEARRSLEWGDWADIDILLRRSPDGGTTWLPRQKLAGEPDLTTNNPTAIMDRRRGIVHFLYNTNYYRCYHVWSADGGLTFSPPYEITHALERLQAAAPWNVAAFGPGHGIRLRSGRLIAPFWVGLGSKVLKGSPRAVHHDRSSTGVIWSDDGGDTWENAVIAVPNAPDHDCPNEATLVELDDGTLMLNIRSRAQRHRRLIALSRTQGETWEAPAFDENLFCPHCFAGFCALPRTGQAPSVLLFSNPDSARLPPPPGKPAGTYARRNLTVRASFDQGRTWPAQRVLETEGSGYSALCAGADGRLFCLYGAGGARYPERGAGDMVLAEFDMNWLLAPTGAKQ
jgi:sialidase-1